MLTEELLRTPLQCQNTSVCKLMSHISLCFWFFLLVVVGFLVWVLCLGFFWGGRGVVLFFTNFAFGFWYLLFVFLDSGHKYTQLLFFSPRQVKLLACKIFLFSQ